jgi:hypothetical protein
MPVRVIGTKRWSRRSDIARYFEDGQAGVGRGMATGKERKPTDPAARGFPSGNSTT